MHQETHSAKTEIKLNEVPVVWDLAGGKLTFFGLDSVLFWTVPSLSNMLSPIAEEVGFDLFRLLVAHSSSLGTEEDYNQMILKLGTNFSEGFLAWGSAVSVAGWGTFEIADFNPIAKQATVIVKNAWELSTQAQLPADKRWGTPFLQGKLIGIFSHAFDAPCWAVDTCYYDAETPYVEIKIFQSKMTIENEINQLRRKRLQDKELYLTTLVEQKTKELKEAHHQIQEYAQLLEQKVEERTMSLFKLNQKLEAEINIRKSAEEKLAALNQGLLAMSYTDSLTGLANRRRFDTALLAEWRRALRTGSTLCLILADVDWFKHYNDTYGHQQGDVCLQTVADVLSNCVTRASDLVARYGGEEFAMILPLTTSKEAARIVEKIIAEFRQLNLAHSNSKYGHVSMSFGIVSMVPHGDKNIEHFIKSADEALYAAKSAGRNQYIVGTSIKVSE